MTARALECKGHTVDGWTIALAVAVMLVGLAGTILPVIPGLAVVWVAALGAWLVDGWGGHAWVTMVVLTALLVAGSAAKYVMAARSPSEDAVSTRARLLAAVLGIVGFFVVPVVGFLLGAVLGLYLGERTTGAGHPDAGRRTAVVVKRFGMGMAIESLAGVLMVATFLLVAVLA